MPPLHEAGPIIATAWRACVGGTPTGATPEAIEPKPFLFPPEPEAGPGDEGKAQALPAAEPRDRPGCNPRLLPHK